MKPWGTNNIQTVAHRESRKQRKFQGESESSIGEVEFRVLGDIQLELFNRLFDTEEQEVKISFSGVHLL